MLDYEFPNSLLAPSARSQQLGMLAGQHHGARRPPKDRDRPQKRKRVTDGAKELLVRAVVPNLNHGARRHQRDRAVLGSEALFHMPGPPEVLVFVFRDAARIFARR